MTTTRPAELERVDRARELRAELLVREAYIAGRARGYLDLGTPRAYRALARLEADAHDAVDAVRRDLGDRRAADVETTPARADIVAAFRREARARLARTADRPRDASIRNALRRAALALAGQFGQAIDAELGAVLAEAGVTGDLERIRGRQRHGAGTVIA